VSVAQPKFDNKPVSISVIAPSGAVVVMVSAGNASSSALPETGVYRLSSVGNAEQFGYIDVSIR
jgi:hypothetical protein